MLHRRDLVRLAVLAALLFAVVFVPFFNTINQKSNSSIIPTLMVLPTDQLQTDIPADPSTRVVVASTATAPPTAPRADISPPGQTPTFTSTHSPTAIVATALPLNSPTPSQPLPITLPAESVPNQVVITFAAEASPQERTAYVQSIGGEVAQAITSLDTVIVEVPRTVQELPPSAVVIAAEPDYYVSALSAVPPNDPLYPNQWSLLAIEGLAEAWSALPAEAAPVAVAVIDSGICANHPDLAGRILPGYDFVDDDTTPQDDFGHGCSVAGIIAANTADGLGIAGIAPNAHVMPLRVLNAQGVGLYSDVAAAIVHAADHGAQVINLSVGGPNRSTTLETAVDYAVSKGVTVVAAAGNTGSSVLYPAAYEQVIAVGSLDQSGERSSFSSSGPEIDVWAPGCDILSTRHSGDWGSVTGTSFAAPHVAGAIALESGRGQTLVFNGTRLAFASSVPAAPTTNPGSSPESIPPEAFADLSAAARDAALTSMGDIEHGGVLVSDIRIEEELAFGIVTVRAPEGVHGSPELIIFLAQQVDGYWQVALESTPLFQAWLSQHETPRFMSQEARAILLDTVTAEGIGSAELSLPYATGETWFLTGGPHHNSGTGGRPWSSLDMAGGTGNVRAAREGVVWRSSACPNFIRIDHADNWQTGYYHLFYEAVTNGQWVTRGQYIGVQGTGIGCGGYATGPHVHFTLRRNGVYQEFRGHDVGGWTVEEGANQYDGCMLRLRDNYRRCRGQGIANEGTIGSVIVPQNWIQNGTFSSGMAGWLTYGGATSRLNNGVLEFYHNTALNSTRPSIFQITGMPVVATAPLELRLDLGNSGPTRKRALVILHNPDWSDLQVCSFWIEPGAPLRTYTMQTRPTIHWTGAQIAVYANPADNTGWLRVDNISLKQLPSFSVDHTLCGDPTAPQARQGADSANLIFNGGFTSGLAGWTMYGNISYQLNNGVMEFIYPVGASVRPSVLQNTGAPLPNQTAVELRLDLGNSSPARQRALVILFEQDWSDLQVCSFWIPPNTPLQTHLMRTHTTKNWSNASIAVYANQANTIGWLQLDNLSLRTRPTLSSTGTVCYEPGANAAALAAPFEELLPSATATSTELPTATLTPHPVYTDTLTPTATATGTAVNPVETTAQPTEFMTPAIPPTEYLTSSPAPTDEVEIIPSPTPPLIEPVPPATELHPTAAMEPPTVMPTTLPATVPPPETTEAASDSSN